MNGRRIMNLKKILLSMLWLPLLTGCSDDENNVPSAQAGAGKGNEYVIYEANPKVFATSGALNAITNRLDEIQSLGTDILWLMPVYEQGVENAIGSPYCVKDYRKINSDYGTLEDLKTLVVQAHGKGMRVILDWVANHTSWDNAWIANKSWYTQDADGNIISPEGMGWADVADLNYDNQDMRQAMQDAMAYWITEADVDGFRCDYAEGVPLDFWATAIDALRQLKGDDLLMLAEGSDASLYSAGFDCVYGWNFAQTLQDVFAGSATVANLYDVHKSEYQQVPAGKFRLRYSTNHDLASERSPLQAYGGARGAMAAFVLASMMDGMPLIYSSQEIGYEQPLSFFGYRIMDWNANMDYQNEYKTLMDIYKKTADLRGGELKCYPTGKVASLYWKNAEKGLFVVVNTSQDAETVKTPIERAGETMKDLVSGETLTLGVTMTLEPCQYMILEKE